MPSSCCSPIASPAYQSSMRNFSRSASSVGATCCAPSTPEADRYCRLDAAAGRFGGYGRSGGVGLDRGGFEAEIRCEPALGLDETHPLALRVVSDLIAVDLPDREIVRLRM